MRVVRSVDMPRERWRNGGGWTRELARSANPTDDFDWRLSLADVEQDGAFSRFDGCDRILVLLGGNGMRLVTGGQPLTLGVPFDFLRFPGELAIVAELLDGPTTDLNLIWRRDRCTVMMTDVRPPSPRAIGGGAGEIAIAFDAGTGTARLGDPGEPLTLGTVAREVGFVIAPLGRP